MIYTCKPSKVAIYDNRKTRLTAAAIRSKLGCGLVINAGYFGPAYNPYGNIKVDGTWLYREQWDIEGFVWNDGELPAMAMTLTSEKDNVYSCLPVIVAGQAREVNDRDREVGGRRGRSGWGVRGDGTFVFLCTTDASGPMLLSEARDALLEAGCVDAVLNDGGASSQISCPSGELMGGRIASNCICVWFDNKKEDKDMDKKYKVCLDPGHGKAEPNQSPDGRYLEYKMAWHLANKIKEHLDKTGQFEVLLTKQAEEETPSLSARANTANAWGADVFVSLHSNAVGGSGWNDTAHGLTAWIYAAGGKREELARSLLTNYETAGVELFGAQLYTARFAVLARTNMPAVLIEHLFHTCRSDVDLLLNTAYLDKLAYAAACGIAEYFSVGIDRLPEPDEEAEAEVKSDIYHTVQVGAFADERNAQAMLELLKSKGINGFVRDVERR